MRKVLRNHIVLYNVNTRPAFKQRLSKLSDFQFPERAETISTRLPSLPQQPLVALHHRPPHQPTTPHYAKPKATSATPATPYASHPNLFTTIHGGTKLRITA